MKFLALADLTDHGRTRLEEDYQAAARRGRCGREDFASGWIACAVHFGLKTIFTSEAWENAPEVDA